MVAGVTRSAVVRGREQSSTIDLAFGRGKVRSAWVHEPGVSDHRAVSCLVTRGNGPVVRTKTVKEVKVTMEVIQWVRANPPEFSEDNSVETLYGVLKDWMSMIRDKCTVERVVKVGARKKAVWFTKELEAMKKRVAVSKGDEKQALRK